MNIEVAKSRYPLPTSQFDRYINHSMWPVVDSAKVSAECLTGEQRLKRTHTTGVMSLVLRYKQIDGAVSSFDSQREDLILLQLQGVRSSVSFRLARGFYWTDFMADEAVAIVSNRASGMRRLAMPKIETIPGIEYANSEQVQSHYRSFATRANLRWSKTDEAYVRDIRRR